MDPVLLHRRREKGCPLAGKVESPATALCGTDRSLSGDVRYAFESLAGMLDLWTGGQGIQKYYSH
jgi:hypothetical protein